MGSLSEIDKAIQTIENTGNKKIIILHCLSIYPLHLIKLTYPE